LASWLLQQQPYVYVAEQLRHYANGVWAPDGAADLAQRVQAELGAKWKASYPAAVELWVMTQTRRAVDAVNLHPGCVNAQNGLLHLETGALLPHSPWYFSLAQLPVAFDPGADTSIVDAFIAQVLPADAIPVFWEVVASCFIRGRYSPKAFVILVGPKDSGKSKVLELLVLFLGTRT
jgi:phage/plasmid-associated DNA primase